MLGFRVPATARKAFWPKGFILSSDGLFKYLPFSDDQGLRKSGQKLLKGFVLRFGVALELPSCLERTQGKDGNAEVVVINVGIAAIAT